MGQRQRALGELLGATSDRLPVPTAAALMASPQADAVRRLYHTLGGTLETPRITLRHWDMVVGDIAIELDEELHFNCYRALILDDPIYDGLPTFPRAAYRAFCAAHAAACVQAGGFGGKWTNPSAARQFGPAGPPRDLAGPGAPRWRQRAFYDAIKDLSPLTIGVTVVRVAIWDVVTVAGAATTVQQALRDPTPTARDAILDLIARRRG